LGLEIIYGVVTNEIADGSYWDCGKISDSTNFVSIFLPVFDIALDLESAS
jgi:hypothetical protein